MIYKINTFCIKLGIRKTVAARTQRRQPPGPSVATAQTNVNATNGQLPATQNLLAVDQHDVADRRRSSVCPDARQQR